MSLIAILLALAVERFLGELEEYRRFDWFERLLARVRSQFEGHAWADGPLGVVIAFAPVLAVVAMAWWVLGSLLWLLGFLFTVVVLVYAFGPRDLEQEVSAWLVATERGDTAGAARHAAELVGEMPTDAKAGARQVYEAVLVEANNRLLGVLFWFVVLGPIGVVLFRLACEARRWLSPEQGGFGKSVHDLYRILIWPSARVVALGYAVAGSFVGAVSRWGAWNDYWRRDSEALLVASGSGALERIGAAADDDAGQVVDALALIRRTLVIVVVLLALMTLAGWAG